MKNEIQQIFNEIDSKNLPLTSNDWLRKWSNANDKVLYEADRFLVDLYIYVLERRPRLDKNWSDATLADYRKFYGELGEWFFRLTIKLEYELK